MMIRAFPGSARIIDGAAAPATGTSGAWSRGWRALLGSLALSAALALTILAVRIALVTMYAKSVPFYDEWGATVSFLTHGQAEGTIGIRSLMHPSNEHTILYSRLLALAEFQLNQGQFDNVPAVLINALIFALTWALAAFLFLRRLPPGAGFVGLAMAAAWIAPLGWENILTGFQSQFAFLVLGALASLWMAAAARSMTPRHTLAFALVNLAACPTMGSGFFAPLVAAGVCLLRAWREPETRRSQLLRAAIALVAAAFGMWLFQRAAHHYAASTIGRFIEVFFSYLGWPFLFSPLVGILVSLPFAVFAIRLLRTPLPGPLDRFALALGIWSAAQIAALALGRETFGGISASRYLDIVAFCPLMNLYALARLAASARGATRQRTLRLVSSVSAAIFIGAIVGRGAAALEDIKDRGSSYTEHTWRISHYLRSGDESVLKSAVFLALPYPDGKVLKQFLDDPLVRDAMPADVRVPLDLRPDSAAGESAFVANGIGPATSKYSDLRVYGSYAADKNATATGAFRSMSMQTRFPFLVMDVAGTPSAPGQTLQLVCDPESACPTWPVAANGSVRQGWQQIVVSPPAASFRLVAADESKTAWFGFDAPRELGAMSHAAATFTNLLRAEPYQALAAVGAIVACLTLLGWTARYRAVLVDGESPLCV